MYYKVSYVLLNYFERLYECDACCLQIDAMRQWLLNESNRRGISSAEIFLITAELQNKYIGIQCSSRFTITYSMLWNVSILPNSCIRNMES